MSGRTLGIVGLGLIGGSVARALRSAGFADRVIGLDPDPAQLEAGLQLGVIDAGETAADEQLKAVDLILIAVPVAQTRTALQEIAPHLRQDAVITDVGSTKQSVLDAAAVLGDRQRRFVAGHPIAGTERSGVAAADAQLFQHRKVILTPTPDLDADALELVRAMWSACGAQVCEMPAAHHDEVLAATSHLPHVLAYALVDCLATMEDRREIFAYAAGGFRDFTRIASSSPRMWHDIVRANRGAILDAMDQFSVHLNQLRTAVAEDDSDAIFNCFERARLAREGFINLLEAQTRS